MLAMTYQSPMNLARSTWSTVFSGRSAEVEHPVAATRRPARRKRAPVTISEQFVAEAAAALELRLQAEPASAGRVPEVDRHARRLQPVSFRPGRRAAHRERLLAQRLHLDGHELASLAVQQRRALEELRVPVGERADAGRPCSPRA